MRGLVSCVSCALAIAVASVTAPARADDATACISAFEDGQKLAAAGKLLSARDRLDACAKPTCPAAVRTDCLQHRDRLERALPTVAVAIRDAEGHDLDATLLLDGKPFEATKGRAVPVDPGPHTFSIVRSGQTRDEQVTIVEGEKSRIVTLTWKEDGKAAAPVPAPSPAPPPSSGPAHESPPTGPGFVPYVLIVGGAVLFGGGVAFGVAGNATNKDADAVDLQRRTSAVDCTAPNVDPNTVVAGSTCGALNASYDRKKDTAGAQRRNAAILGIVGLGSMVAGVVWLVVAPRRSASAPRVVPLIDASTAGAALFGTL